MASPTGGTWRRPSRDGATCRSFCTETNPFVLTDVSIGIWFEFHVWGVDPSAIFIDSIDQKMNELNGQNLRSKKTVKSHRVGTWVDFAVFNENVNN